MAVDPAAPHEEAPVANARLEDTRSRSSASLVEMLERLGGWTVALLARPRVRDEFRALVAAAEQLAL